MKKAWQILKGIGAILVAVIVGAFALLKLKGFKGVDKQKEEMQKKTDDIMKKVEENKDKVDDITEEIKVNNEQKEKIDADLKTLKENQEKAKNEIDNKGNLDKLVDSANNTPGF